MLLFPNIVPGLRYPRGGNRKVRLAPPTLTIEPASDTGTPGDNVTEDVTPTVIISAALQFGDDWQLQIDDNSGFSDPIVVDDIVGNLEVLAAEVSKTIAALAPGTWYLRAMYSRGDDDSPWSTTLTLTVVDLTAPALSGAIGTKTGQTTAGLSVTTDEAGGTLYGVLTASATPPSKAQVKAGQNDGGTSADYAFSQAVSATGVQNKSATGLTADTTYYAYFMHEDAFGNQSNVAAAASFTTDPAVTPEVFIGPPEVRYVNFGNIGGFGNQLFSANGGNDLPSGLFVLGILSTNATAPTTVKIGSTNLTRVDDGQGSAAIQLWAAAYGGGSDVITIGPMTGQGAIGIAPAWTNFALDATPTAANDQEYAATNASNANRMVLDGTIDVPADGVGFVVAGTIHSTLSANDKNWANVDTSPTPSDGYTATRGRVSIAVKFGATASWNPQFWGSGTGYNFAAGMHAVAFGP